MLTVRQKHRDRHFQRHLSPSWSGPQGRDCNRVPSWAVREEDFGVSAAVAFVWCGSQTDAPWLDGGHVTGYALLLGSLLDDSFCPYRACASSWSPPSPSYPCAPSSPLLEEEAVELLEPPSGEGVEEEPSHEPEALAAPASACPLLRTLLPLLLPRTRIRSRSLGGGHRGRAFAAPDLSARVARRPASAGDLSRPGDLRGTLDLPRPDDLGGAEDLSRPRTSEEPPGSARGRADTATLRSRLTPLRYQCWLCTVVQAFLRCALRLKGPVPVLGQEDNGRIVLVIP